MLHWFELFELFSHFIFSALLGYYVITNLQWYNYKVYRVAFHHNKLHWHFFYLILPLIVYYLSDNFFLIYFYIAYIPSLFLWYKKLDKKLVFTSRVKRFFTVFILFVFMGDFLCFSTDTCKIFSVLMPLVFTIITTQIVEKVLLDRYAKAAKEKISNLKNLTIIAITGSYGKTSLKNFLAQILQDDFRVYATPRSVNTFAGLVQDINTSLSSFTDIYIAEAGARGKGDIKEIANLLNHHYAILGKIGKMHIEYFKTLENIIEAKSEILQSSRLKKAFVYKENPIKFDSNMIKFPDEVRGVDANLEKTSFEMKIDGEFVKFETSVLGEFNIINISAAIMVAKYFGMSSEKIQKRVALLKPTDHRLQKIEVNSKLIIDDSFNGNLEGMLEGIRLSSLFEGRKVIITPGLIESDEKSNIELALAIDKVFDMAIITGELNSKILSSNINRAQKIVLKDKSNLENILKGSTKEGDLILFANDAPSYV